MKRKDNIGAILFITALTVVVWFWAAGKTKYTSDVTVTVFLSPPEGSTSTISPESTSVTLALSGARTAVDSAKSACDGGLHLTLSDMDEQLTLSEISRRLASLDSIKDTGAMIDEAASKQFPLTIHTVELVEAIVEVQLPNVTASGDVTVDPETVTLHIPRELRKSLPKAITATAVVSEIALQKLQPGIVHTKDAIIRLPEALAIAGVTASPSRVAVTFKIQSSTKTKELPQVRVLIAGPAEDYSSYSVTLARKIIPFVTIEADAEIIKGIDAGDVKVFAILRLASSEMEQQISTKRVSAFLAIMKDGTGHELVATVGDPSLLDIELEIEPIAQSNIGPGS
jgi:hypothetical protein